VLLGALVVYAAATLPSLDNIGKATGTIRLLDRHGKLIAEFGHDNTSRTYVPLARISPTLQDATIATEDRNFYDEGAFNFGRIIKALFVDVIARRPSQGASTITQQLAKLAFFGPDAQKSVLRKLREALLANQIDRSYSKQEILEKYLNLIYYGHGAYGIENASEIFFGKHAAELDLREASLLAGLPQAPGLYDPFENHSAAFARQHIVLVSMVEDGKLSVADADAIDPTTGDADAQAAKQNAVLSDLAHGRQTATSVAPHFVQYVREQLEEKFKDDPAVTAGTLTVTTTLDLDLQAKADAAVKNGVAKIGNGANNGALLMIDSHGGDILALVGSRDFEDASIDGQYDVVTGERRPGSSFKPYVYEEGFRSGALQPGSMLDDTAEESRKLGNLHDFDGRFMGKMTAARALLLSRNVPAVQAMTIVGVQDVIDFAHTLGITSDLAMNPNTAIGSSAVRMLDHATAYAAFSNGGRVVESKSILKVVDGSGQTLLDDSQPSVGDQVMTAQQDYSLTKILIGYPQQWGLPFRHQTAGKSGTTDHFVDAWYMAYTPDFVVATWAGHTEADRPGEIPMDGVFGTTVGRQIAVPFVNSLPDNRFHNFSTVPGSLTDCASPDVSLPALSAAVSGCPTPSATPSLSPSPSPSPSPTATPTETPTSTPKPKPTPTPTPTATPAATAAPILPPPAPP